jgi:hypothetical protein
VLLGCQCSAGDRPGTANPLWELPSFSEAAKAAVLLVEVLASIIESPACLSA